MTILAWKFNKIFLLKLKYSVFNYKRHPNNFQITLSVVNVGFINFQYDIYKDPNAIFHRWHEKYITILANGNGALRIM